MEEHRGVNNPRTVHAWMRVNWVGVLCVFSLSCAQEHESFPYERLYDRSLRVTEIKPNPDTDPVAVNQTFRITFNTYLNADLLNDYNGLSLASGGVRSFGVVRYSMTERTLTWTSTRRMEPGLKYTLTFEDEVLRSVTEQPYEGPTGAVFRVEDRSEERQEDPPRVRWSDVEPIFETCNQCHADPEWKLSPLRYEELVGVRSDQKDSLFLVHPYNPTQSYLMHKILWDYPLRNGSAQPPPWDGGQQLSQEEQLRIERWILGGAVR